MFQHCEVIDVVDFLDYPCDKLDKSVKNVVKLLSGGCKTLATAESCTGGLLSELLTAVDGASAVFECGVCTYSNRMKEKMLGVPHELLVKYGAVSRQVAEAMVQGLSEISGADICVSVTGIAGPAGGTPDKPVGTVYVGLLANGQCQVFLLQLWHNAKCERIQNRRQTAAFVMKTIETLLMEERS